MCTYVSSLCMCIVATETPDRCTLPAESGLCKAAFQRFYFNSDSGQCEQFIFGGCGGNDNNFETMEQCQQTCKYRTVLFCQSTVSGIIEVFGNVCNSDS